MNEIIVIDDAGRFDKGKNEAATRYAKIRGRKAVKMRLAKITEMARRKEIQAGILMERAKQLYERVEAIETGMKPKMTKYQDVMYNLEIKNRKEVYKHMCKKFGKSKSWVYMCIVTNPDQKFKYQFDMQFDYITRLLGYKNASK